MARASSPEQRQQWKDRISEQRQSGDSIASWCLNQNISPRLFYYWQDKFFPKPPVEPLAFIEVMELKSHSQKTTGIKIEHQGLVIHLDRDFDATSLKQCLAILKELSC